MNGFLGHSSRAWFAVGVALCVGACAGVSFNAVRRPEVMRNGKTGLVSVSAREFDASILAFRELDVSALEELMSQALGAKMLPLASMAKASSYGSLAKGRGCSFPGYSPVAVETTNDSAIGRLAEEMHLDGVWLVSLDWGFKFRETALGELDQRKLRSWSREAGLITTYQNMVTEMLNTADKLKKRAYFARYAYGTARWTFVKTDGTRAWDAYYDVITEIEDWHIHDYMDSRDEGFAKPRQGTSTMLSHLFFLRAVQALAADLAKSGVPDVTIDLAALQQGLAPASPFRILAAPGSYAALTGPDAPRPFLTQTARSPGPVNPSADEATVVVIRPGTDTLFHGFIPVVDELGSLVAYVGPGTHAWFRVKPGPHDFTSWVRSSSYVRGNFKAGLIYVIDMDLNRAAYALGDYRSAIDSVEMGHLQMELSPLGPSRAHWTDVAAWMARTAREELIPERARYHQRLYREEWAEQATRAAHDLDLVTGKVKAGFLGDKFHHVGGKPEAYQFGAADGVTSLR